MKKKPLNPASNQVYVEQRRAEGGGKGGQSPPKVILGGDCPPPKFSKTKKFLSKTSLYGLKYYKIVKKWSENASSKVQKSKIFLHIPRSLGPSGLGAYNRPFGLRFVLSSPPKKNSSARPWSIASMPTRLSVYWRDRKCRKRNQIKEL